MKTSSVAGVAALAGCVGGGDDDDGEDPGADLPDVELYDADGEERIEPAIIYDSGSQTSEDIAAAIASDLELIGVDLQMEPRPEVLGEDFFSEPLPDEDPDDFEWGPVGRNAGPPDRTQTVFDWDILIGIGANSYPRTPDNTDVFWLPDAAVNAYGYVPEADIPGMYDDFGDAEDDAERQEILNNIMGALTEELPANFLSQGLDFFGFRDDIHTSDDFNLYGAEMTSIERYRGDQSVGGDYVRLEATPFSQGFLPEQDDNNSAMRTALMCDGAYAVGTDDEIIPLHIDIEDSGDSQVWVCTLRDNLMYGEDADGNSYGQMTAEDWVFQLENLHAVGYDDPEDVDYWDSSVPPSEATASYAVVENVEQTGELEFQLELFEPDPFFPFRPVIWGEDVLPMALFEQYAPDPDALRESDEVTEFTWTGNLGPYQFDDRVAGAAGSFTLTRNDDYYMREHTEESNVQVMDEAFADAPYFDLYQFDNESEQSTRVERFRAGEGDRMGLPTDVIQEFEEAVDDVRVEDQQTPYINFMFYNQRANGSELTRERDGREAIARVVDKETITQDIQQGYAEPAVTFQPTWSNWYDESAVNVYGVDITDEDIIAARELLENNDNFTLEEV
ncbi:ABC transporter substrate-binding protein [Halovivax gelatinilyticus]|uniref:ABC transporter substrate-binding protein n=1 Tax=Halovivax gelatinilyticus TaxID=2961597 RepID=UPI0020CA97ED|nr:ABC transporter substrate-binding protein [Halovivax gelatinilyticus]